MGWWRINGYGIPNQFIQHAGLNTHGLLICHIFYQLRNSMNTLTSQGRSIYYRSILQEADFITKILSKPQGRLVVLIWEYIPFVYHNNNALARFMGIAGNLLILLCNALLSVNHHQHYISSIHSPQRTHNAITLNSFINLATTAHTCCINQHKFNAIGNKMGINGISSSTSHIADNNPVLTNQCINNGGFAYIWTANNRNADFILILVLTSIFWESCHYRIQQISQANGIRCSNANRIPQAKAVKLIDSCLQLWAVYLIYCYNNRLFGIPQHTAYFLVSSSQTRAAIYHEYDYIGLLHSHQGLLTHGLKNMICILKFNTACIYNGKIMIQPFSLHINTITSYPRHIINNRHPPLANLIKKSRLAHIWAAYNSNYRLTHLTFLLSWYRLRCSATYTKHCLLLHRYNYANQPEQYKNHCPLPQFPPDRTGFGKSHPDLHHPRKYYHQSAGQIQESEFHPPAYQCP